MFATGKAYKVDKFSTGEGGHDPTDPSTALAPDPGTTTCPSVTFGPKLISSVEQQLNFCDKFVCTLEEDEGVGVISNICLIGTIVYNPVDPLVEPVGTTFLWGIANMPFRTKTDVEETTFNVIVKL